MTKVYPNTASEVQRRDSGRHEAEVLTVWKKSLLFNCTGFTVFDAKGNLVFRVDNYVAGNKGEIVLMDAAGKPLLTIRRKVIRKFPWNPFFIEYFPSGFLRLWMWFGFLP